jgi:hypothetical protein
MKEGAVVQDKRPARRFDNLWLQERMIVPSSKMSSVLA